MNEMEKAFVKGSLPSLIQYTKCNKLLLATLLTKEILNPEDCQELEALGRNEGEISQAYLLYNTLITRANSFDILLDVLQSPEQNQSGAAKILANGRANHFALPISSNDPHSQVIFQFTAPPSRLVDLFYNERKPVVVISTEDISVTTRRLTQDTNLQGHTFCVYTTKDALRKDFDKVSSGNVMLLAMHGQKIKALEEALNVLKQIASGNRQCIVMTTVEQDEVTNKIIGEPESFGGFTDDLKWNHLSSDFQTELLQKQVIFQGQEITLNNFLDRFSQSKELLNTLETKFLMQLINDEKPTFCQNTLQGHPKTPFYIERKLVPRKVAISSDILESGNSSSETSFAISGMSRAKLLLLKAGKVSSAEDEIRSRTVGISSKFILVENAEQFVSLCNRMAVSASCAKNLHWLNKTDNSLEWVRSYGEPNSIEVIQKFVIFENRDKYAIPEQDFVTDLLKNSDYSGTPVVCISDNPGMGKTTLIAHFGELLLAKYQSSKTFVQYFVMTDIMRDCEQLGILDEAKLTKELILQILLNRITSTEVVKHVFQQIGTQCELLLDGFDEVLPHQVKLAVKFISMLRYQFKLDTGPTFRIWLTTRPVLLSLVEQTLGVLGYNMLAFDEQDQITFLKLYWTEQTRKRGIQLKPNKLESFTKGTIQMMEKVNGKLSQFEVDMTGIPLQCLLLAQVCEGAVNFECSVEGNSNKGAINLEQESPENLAIKNLSDLYSRVMDKKLEIFLNRESSNSHLQSHLSKNKKQVMKRIHMKLALELLYPEWSHQFEAFFLHESNISTEELSIYGFVTEYNQNKPVFVHRTYAEYFVALFAVEFGLCERLLKGFQVGNTMAKFYLDGLLVTKPETEKING